MTQQIPVPKKVVGKTVAVTLGIICIILVAVLIYSVGMMESANNKISNLQNENSFLKSQIDGLNNIANLSEIDLWKWAANISQPPMSNYSWSFSASYAGYLLIILNVYQNSTNNVYIRLVWSYKNVVNYDNTTYGGVVKCAILPCPNVTITIGNSDASKGLSGEAYIQYIY
jgi:hypothetical protein